MSTWTLPGFEVEEMLGFGATGEVWRARETSTGEVVALKRLRAEAPPTALAALHREAALLADLDTPYVVRLRQVVGDVLVLDHAAGGSLAALLSRRGSLGPGEVVTVCAPLASALAAAHAQGLVHGDVSPANVLFTADGMPLLADLGGARLADDASHRVDGTAEYVDPAVASGDLPSPSSDVWALGALCHHLLSGAPPHDGQSVAEILGAAVLGARAPLGLLAPAAPRPLVAVVESALSDDPSERPSAAALAVALQRAEPAEPVRLTGAPAAVGPVPDVRATHVVPRPAPLPEPPPPRRRRPSLPSLPVLAAAVVVLVLLVAGLAWARSGGPPAPQALPSVADSADAPLSSAAAPGAAPAPRASAAPASPAGPAAPAAPTRPPPELPEWPVVLDELDRLRERAFAAGDPGLLARVYLPGSEPAAADAAALTGLTSAGRTAVGVRHEVRRIEQTAYTGDRAELRVVDVLAAHELRDAQGVVQALPGRGEAAYAVVLARLDGGWRIADLDARPG